MHRKSELLVRYSKNSEIDPAELGVICESSQKPAHAHLAEHYAPAIYMLTHIIAAFPA